MRLVFLGTGTSAGIPAIACSCDVCTSTDPRDRRLRTSAAIEWTDPQGHPRVAIIDTGPDLRQQALTRRLQRCDAIFFTHNHVDHTFGLDEVRRFNAVMHAPIRVHAEPHTMDSLQRVYQHIFDKHRNVNDSFVASLLPMPIDAQAVDHAEPIITFGMAFTPIRLIHGRLPILGFRIEPTPALRDATDPDILAHSPFPLAYCTDVSAIPSESWPRLQGLKTLVLDALRHRAHPTHFTLAQAVAAADALAATHTYFVHMAHDLPHQTTQDQLPEGMSLAHDGLVLGRDDPQ